MSDKKTSEEKPVTLADYIPDEPLITPAAKKAARESLSAADRARLEALERAVRETEPDAVHQSKKKRGKSKKSRANQPRQHDARKKNNLVFWAIVVMLIVGFAMMD
ncbi:MAG: hypothetical protein AAFP97_03885 [Pseudomonadota bacterium]